MQFTSIGHPLRIRLDLRSVRRRRRLQSSLRMSDGSRVSEETVIGNIERRVSDAGPPR